MNLLYTWIRMKLFILKADNSAQIDKISQDLSQKKFKEIEKDDNFSLMRRKRYGNILIHVVCLIIALGYFSPAIFINVIYFVYSYMWASPNVLITTEKNDSDGNPLEFDEMDELLNKANSIL